jgi:hypothetical protein
MRDLVRNEPRQVFPEGGGLHRSFAVEAERYFSARGTGYVLFLVLLLCWGFLELMSFLPFVFAHSGR